MRILQGYLRRAVIFSILLVSLTLLGIETFMEFINELPDIGKHNYGIFQAILYVLMQLPSCFYELFPIAGFLGALLGIGRLANYSELIVMRASGVSIIRITWIVAKTAVLLLLLVGVVGEWGAPNLQYQANLMKLADLQKTETIDKRELWIREGNTFLHVQHVKDPTDVSQLTSYKFNLNNQLVRATAAHSAIFTGNAWKLHDVDESNFTQQQIKMQHYLHRNLDFNFKPQLLQQLNRDTNEETLSELWHNIQLRHQAGLVATSYELDYWQRVMRPLTTLVMICLGVPFVFGSLRQASTSARVVVGISIGFGLYMSNHFIGPLTLVYQWPPWLVAALPTLLFMSVCVVLLWRTR